MYEDEQVLVGGMLDIVIDIPDVVPSLLKAALT
jgi:hypothetical protein